MKQIKKLAPIALLLLSVFIIGIRAYRNITNFKTINLSDDVMKWEPRIQPLRDSLPKDIDQIGYLDQSFIIKDIAPFDHEEFYLMQYSIAPVALEIGFEQPWIIGNFDDDADLQSWLDENIGWYEIRSFGFGLYLIHKLDE